MAQIFAECRRLIKHEGIMTVMFNHKSTTAWDSLTVALINAGFSITRTWPVKTEGRIVYAHQRQSGSPHNYPTGLPTPGTQPHPGPLAQGRGSSSPVQYRTTSRTSLSQADLKPIDLYLSRLRPGPEGH